jgi:hypothetical protein
MILNAIILIGIVVGISYVAKGVSTQAAGDKLKSDIDGLKWRGISNGKIKLDLIFQHANPTSTALPIDFIFLDIFISDKKFASIRQDSLNFKIPANKVINQTISIEVPLTQVGLSVGQLIIAGKIPENATVTGSIKVNGFVTEYNKIIPIKPF